MCNSFLRVLYSCLVCWLMLVLQLPTAHAIKYYSCTDAIRRNTSYKRVVLAFPTIPDFEPIQINGIDCTLSGPLCGGDLVMHRYGDFAYRFSYILTAQGPHKDIVYIFYTAATVEENRPTTIQLTLKCSTAQPSVTQLVGDCYGEQTTHISGTLLTAGGCVGLQTQTSEQSPSDTLSSSLGATVTRGPATVSTTAATCFRSHTPFLHSASSSQTLTSPPMNRRHSSAQTVIIAVCVVVAVVALAAAGAARRTQEALVGEIHVQLGVPHRAEGQHACNQLCMTASIHDA